MEINANQKGVSALLKILSEKKAPKRKMLERKREPKKYVTQIRKVKRNWLVQKSIITVNPWVLLKSSKLLSKSLMRIQATNTYKMRTNTPKVQGKLYMKGPVVIKIKENTRKAKNTEKAKKDEQSKKAKPSFSHPCEVFG